MIFFIISNWNYAALHSVCWFLEKWLTYVFYQVLSKTLIMRSFFIGSGTLWVALDNIGIQHSLPRSQGGSMNCRLSPYLPDCLLSLIAGGKSTFR